jgi:hypothetical protein
MARRALPSVSAAAALSTFALTFALLLGGCGGQDAGPAATDGAAWKATFESAMDALGKRDYRAFTGLMSSRGRETLEKDLVQFTKSLAHPTEGPRLLKNIRARWPEVPDALVVSARGGDVEAAWNLFLGAATPAGVRPRLAGMRLATGNQDVMALRYRYSENDDLGIELRRIRGKWSVDAIELRKTS